MQSPSGEIPRRPRECEGYAAGMVGAPSEPTSEPEGESQGRVTDPTSPALLGAP
jgi:hypothetical protein